MKFYKGFTIEPMTFILCGFNFEIRTTLNKENVYITMRVGFISKISEKKKHTELLKLLDGISLQTLNDFRPYQLINNKIINKFMFEVDVLE